MAAILVSVLTRTLRQVQVLLVLGKHRSGQGVGRRVVDQLQHLFVVLLRININRQNRPEDFLHKKPG